MSGKFGSFVLVVLSSTVVELTGCTSGSSFPDVNIATQTSLGSIHGSNFGGHAPLIGTHLYVLQASTAAYGGQPTSLLSTTYSSGTAYPATENTSDPYIPTTGTGTPWYYLTTDANGEFSISGDYTCTSGLPVYLYAYGGAPTTLVNSSTITQFTAQTAATAGSSLLFTVSTTGSFTAGEQVALSGFSGSYAFLNGQSAAVLSSPSPTSTTFELSGLTGAASLNAGTTYTTSGTATPDPSFNPGIVNLLMLGVCPSSGNFSTGGTLYNGSTFTPLNYVYINEVSTVAMAYAMAGFGTDGLHLGTDTSAAATLTAPGIIGIQNAAMNAGNLYDIQGQYISTVNNGEGHIANPTTFAGSQNGTVPQAELDTLGNILAACVDSGNTYNPVSGTGTKNLACTGSTASTSSPSLLLNASSNGGNSGGTTAPNTAAAAFNIAHYPMTTNVVALYTLPGGTVPFTPHLTAQPNDFTVGIIYASTANATSGASANGSLASPTGIAIDSSGNAYISASTSSASTLTQLSPLGAALHTNATLGTGMDFVAVDQAGNVWALLLGVSNGQSGTGSLYKFNSTLSTVSSSYSASLNVPTSIAIDKSNNVFVSLSGSFSNGGGAFSEFQSPGYAAPTPVNSSFLQGVPNITVDANENLWATSPTSNDFCQLTTTGKTNFSGNSGYADPYNIALDGNGNGWFGNHGQTNVFKVSSTGTSTSEGKVNTNFYSAGLYQPSWSAIDGGGNVYVINDNGANSSVSEISNTGVALSCPSCNTTNNGSSYGYQPGNVGAITSNKLNSLIYPGFLAVDPSGDLWITNFNSNTVLEIIGVGTPLVTPLSSQKFGTAP